MDPVHDLAAARALFPWWVTWGSVIAPPVLTLAAAFVIGRATLYLCARPLVRTPNVHWTVRGLLVTRLRTGILIVYVLAVLVGPVAAFVMHGGLAPVEAGVAGFVIVCFGTWLGTREYGRVEARFGIARPVPSDMRIWLGNVIALSPFVALLAVAMFLPSDPNAWQAMLALGVSALALAWGMGVGVLLATRLRVIPYKTITELGLDPDGAQWPMRRVLLLRTRTSNAYALVFIGEVAISRHLLDELTHAELVSVLRHEARHLLEPRRNGLLRLFPYLVVILLAWWRVIAAHPMLGLLALAFLVAVVVLNGARKKMAQHAEDDADHAGGSADPVAYARALEKLYEWNVAAVVQKKRHSHADLHERMLAAGVTPSWARPELPPPLSKAWLIPLIAVLLALEIAFMVFRDVPRRHAEHTTEWHVAFGGSSALALSNLAYRAFGDDRLEESLVLYRAAAAADPADPYHCFSAARTLVRLGQCGAAISAATEGERRLELLPEPAFDSPWLVEVRAEVDGCRR